MTTTPRAAAFALVVVMLAASLVPAAELDRSAVDFIPPSEIKWIRNEVVIQVWGMGPATSTPAEKK